MLNLSHSHPHDPDLRTQRLQGSQWFVLALGLFLSIRLALKAISSSEDFEVFWRAAHSWLSGVSPYVLDPAAAPGFVFKYPPWAVPVLSPLGVVPFWIARSFWVGVQGLSLFTVLRILFRFHPHAWKTLTATSLAFWWILQNHFYWGQISLPLLALYLTATRGDLTSSLTPSVKLSVIATFFSWKVHTLFGLFFHRHPLLKPKGAGIFFALLGALLLICSLRLGSDISPGILLNQWKSAALGSAQALGFQTVWGVNNHGLYASLRRVFFADLFSNQNPALLESLDFWFPWALLLVFNLGWARAARERNRFSPLEVISGHLALTAVALPLAWDHSYVWALPLSFFAALTRSPLRLAVAWLSIAGIGLSGPQIWGPPAMVLEFYGIKAISVIALAVLLASRTPSQERPS